MQEPNSIIVLLYSYDIKLRTYNTTSHNFSFNQDDNVMFNIPHLGMQRVLELLLSIPTHKATEDDGISPKL